MDPTLETFLPLAIALGLGLLVGLQREWSAPNVAGIRTFALVTVFGALTALLAETFGGWLVGAGLLVVGAMTLATAIMKVQTKQVEPGLTTSMAALLMYGVGAILVLGYTEVGIAVAGGIAVLLHSKQPLHQAVDRIGDKDIRAIMQLTLIALVILPLLPNQTYDQLGVLNPFKIWLMVVLIVGISLAAYLVQKFFGGVAGTLLCGIFGGLISSTATSASYARQSRETPDAARVAAVVVMIASTIVFARVLTEIAVVAPSVFPALAPPLVAMMAVMIVIALAAFVIMRPGPPTYEDDQGPPGEFKAAVVFGALYMAVITAVATAKHYVGDTGLYVVAAISGLTDMDAITISTAQLVDAEKIAPGTGWRLIVVGAMSNLIFKAGIVATLGNRAMFTRIAIMFTLSLAAAITLLFLWPQSN